MRGEYHAELAVQTARASLEINRHETVISHGGILAAMASVCLAILSASSVAFAARLGPPQSVASVATYAACAMSWIFVIVALDAMSGLLSTRRSKIEMPPMRGFDSSGHWPAAEILRQNVESRLKAPGAPALSSSEIAELYCGVATGFLAHLTQWYENWNRVLRDYRRRCWLMSLYCVLSLSGAHLVFWLA